MEFFPKNAQTERQTLLLYKVDTLLYTYTLLQPARMLGFNGFEDASVVCMNVDEFANNDIKFD